MKSIFEQDITSEKITVLGIEFNSEEERREYFRNELRKKLPELKKMEGFPIGEDDDILNLSDPPYYTACPNPWLNDFIEEWEERKLFYEKEGKRFTTLIVTEPYSSDVSEGKNNPIYNAHTYHTKVPHLAIMRYLKHYTQPGDIVFDGFAGTGMTGVAANSFNQTDDIFQIGFNRTEENRFVILNDLSPIASFIGYNLNRKLDLKNEYEEAIRILKKIKVKYENLYSVVFNGKKYIVEYEILSENYHCPSCGEINDYLGAVLDEIKWEVNKDFKCKSCDNVIDKTLSNKVFNTSFDRYLNESVIMNSYTIKFLKLKNKNTLIPYNDCKVSESEIKESFIHKPIKIIDGVKTNDAIKIGRKHIHQFYDNKSFIILNELWNESKNNELLKFTFTSVVFKNLSLLNNMSFRNGGVNLAGALPNAIYFPSNIANRNPILVIENKLNKLIKILQNKNQSSIIQTGSATKNSIKSDSIDYIFTDPPFGANLMYSELNFIYESWLKIFTNNKTEAIINSKQNKSIHEYQSLMDESFKEYYRVLKPNKWMTVEFSNTSAIVWNAIQNSINKAGFIIANVSGLDKKQGTYNSKTTTTAVKQDLAISCYKPSSDFELKFIQNNNSSKSVWEFIEEHLNHLPIHLQFNNSTTAIIERNPKILYDRLISFYIQRGCRLPIFS